MKILVLGSGGREHAICHQIGASRGVEILYCAPGSDGMNPPARPVGLDLADVEAIARFARDNRIDLTFSGPETPLATGIADCFAEAGLPFVGPRACAARLESSKAFTRDFLGSLGVPSPRYRVCQTAEESLAPCRQMGFPLVIKADGLAAGKGVVIARSEEEASAAIQDMMVHKRFGESGSRIVLEEFLQGTEVSYMVFTDGKHFHPLPAARDHKKAFDGDQGPNTGGMGAYSHDQILTPEQCSEIDTKFIVPVLRGMTDQGCPFVGVLYAGLMKTADGFRILEYNVRLGDPETQAVLPRLQTDILDLFEAMRLGRLDQCEPRWDNRATVCLSLVSRGYPDKYEKGFPIRGLEQFKQDKEVVIFHAGTRRAGGAFVTTGGRVLSVVGKGDTLAKAADKAYDAAGRIHFDNIFYRKDIGRSSAQ